MARASLSNVLTQSDYDLIFLRELNEQMLSKFTSNRLYSNLLSTPVITGLSQFPLSRYNIFQSLYFLSKVHQHKKLDMIEMTFIAHFWHAVQNYAEVRQFLYQYNYLKIATLLLKNCSAPLCRTIVMNTIVELVEEKKNGAVNLNVMDCIGEDLVLVNIITSYLRSFETILLESCLLHNILRFFNFVAFTVITNPESPWVNHLKKEHLYFEKCIIFVLEHISLPCDILQSIFYILLQLLETFPDPSMQSISWLNTLFNVQKLLYGLMKCTYLRFLIECDDASLVDWTLLETWLNLMHNINEFVSTQQFADTSKRALCALHERIKLLHKKLYHDKVDLQQILDVSYRSYVELIISRVRKPIEDLRDTLDRYLTDK